MTLRAIVSRILPTLLCGIMGLFNVSAASLQFDFGPTTVAPADALRSPGHAIGAVPAPEVTWNKITLDTNTLYYGDGTPATGLSIELGRSSAVGFEGNDIIDYNDNGFTATSALGGVQNTGVYAGTSPVRDGIFGGSGGANNLAIGLRIDGLAPGTYTLYFHGRNTSA